MLCLSYPLGHSSDCPEYRQRISGAGGFSLFKVLPALPHRIGYMRETKNIHFGNVREGVKRRSFHFDRNSIFRPGPRDGIGGFAKGRVGRPTRSDNYFLRLSTNSFSGHCNKCRIGIRELCRRRIVIAGALVSQRSVDNDKKRRLVRCCYPAGRRETYQEIAAAGEQFFRDQNGERRTDYTSNYPDRLT